MSQLWATRRVAMLPASGSPLYYAGDMLGSSRMIVNPATGQPCYDADFGPFGEERTYVSNCPNQNNYKFEGKERDTETGNDDFGARYYTWRFGRWLSADWSSVPVPVPYANLTNPQTLNLYSMVSDDPESFADLDGHQGQDQFAKTQADGTPCPGAANSTGCGAQPQAAAQQQNTDQGQQNQQQTSSQGKVNYKPGIPPAEGKLEQVVKCTQNCTGKDLTVTSTNETVKGHSDIHQPDTPHGRGEAADIRLPGGKADVGKALQCAANCGAKAAFDEYDHPSPHATGPHLHIQTVPTKSGGRADLPEPEE